MQTETFIKATLTLPSWHRHELKLWQNVIKEGDSMNDSEGDNGEKEGSSRKDKGMIAI